MMASQPLYDTIGSGYARSRRPDPRIASTIADALGDAGSVVNVGAGTGSYEPAGRRVMAVEPSWTMIGQRPYGAAPAVRALAEELPFPAASFDAALAILTVHHWSDRGKGLGELRRVARRKVVVYTWEPSTLFWLVSDYFPRIAELDRARFPRVDEFADALGDVIVQPVPVRHDCTDGFLGAYWRRPEAYLDPSVRASMSCFPLLPESVVKEGIDRLRDDLATGAWHARHASLLDLNELDLGYRLVIAEL